MMYLIKDKEPTLNWRYISKRILVGMIYPFIICVAVNINTIIDEPMASLLVSLYILIPFLLIICCYVISRSWYSIISIWFDQSKGTFHMAYTKGSKRLNIAAPASELHIKLGNDPASIHEFLLLEISYQNRILIKQYQEGEWGKDDFFKMVKSLSECGVKCAYSFAYKKQIEQSETLLTES